MSLLMPETEQVERTPIDDTGSLSEHEALYQPKPGAEPVAPAAPEPTKPAVEEPVQNEETQAALEDSRDPMGRFRPKDKHRAQKDKARPEDVPRIKELTRKLREAEEKLAAATVPPAAPPVAMPASAVPSVPQTAAGPVNEKFTFPAYDKWAETNPNTSWDDWNDAKTEARIDWRRAKDREDEQRTTYERTMQQSVQQELQTFIDRRTAYLQLHPEHASAFQMDTLAKMPATPAIERMLKRADNGPELVYTLQHRPDLLAGLVLLTDGKPASDGYVALATQWLHAQLVTGTTAAVPSAQTQRQPPKPPTAVRTGPMKTGAEPPGDGASLAEHEAFYNRRSR